MTNQTDLYQPLDEPEKYFIKSIWRVYEYNIQQRTETILPKGTVEIIFNLSDDVTYCDSALDNRQKAPPCFINGINFKPIHLIKNGQQQFLGIQLNAIGLKVLFNEPAKEFNNNIIDGSQVCKSLSTLYNQLFIKKTFEEQIECILKWIDQRISISKYYKSINRIHNLFYTPKTNELTVSKFCVEANISERQLRRTSNEWLGMNTETFLLYNKYLSSLYLLHHSNFSLTQIGLEAGYFDQSHFIREFKSFTDLTPKEYQLSNTTLPGHIIR